MGINGNDGELVQYQARNQDHFRSQRPTHIPQPRTFPLMASPICSLEAFDFNSSLGRGSLRATTTKKSRHVSYMILGGKPKTRKHTSVDAVVD
jgi:hypothetical protein